MASRASAAAAKSSPKPLHAPQPQAKIKVDFKSPRKTGFLTKAGGKTNKSSFKSRFFALYKNFLVYYDDETKWKRDITVERMEVIKSCGSIYITGVSAITCQVVDLAS